MKYYIKILRSNLDNILSSESISPAAFYGKLGYGYNRFDHASDDTSDYELYLSEGVDDSEEDVAYIEFLSDDYRQLTGIDNCVSCGHTVNTTLRLYPWNCRILFRSVEDAKETIFICRSSLANKMWGCYVFDVISDVRPVPTSPNYAAGPIPSDLSTEIQRDRKVNCLKGFVFAYYLGKACSLTPQLAMLLRAERHIYGLATALAGMKSPSKEMVDTVENLKKIFNANDPNRLELKHRWEKLVLGSFTTVEDGKHFEEQLKRLGVQRQAMDAFASEQGIKLSPRFDVYYATDREWADYKNQITEYTQSILNQYTEEKRLEDNDPLSVDGYSAGFSDQGLKLYERLLAEMMKNTAWLSIDRIRTQKLDTANDATMFVKKVYEEANITWEGSECQEYWNRLRRNIAYSEPFDPNWIHDRSLRALAIYILKGDTIDEMYKYMQMTGVEEYGLAFGLWGVSMGYVDMPKTFPVMLGLKQERVIDCYVRAYEVMTGRKVPKRPVADSYQEVLQKEMKVQNTGAEWSRLLTKRTIETNSKVNHIEELLKDSPLKLTNAQQAEILEIVENGRGAVDDKDLKAIGKIKGIGKKKLEQIKDVLKPISIREEDALLFREEPTMQMNEDFTPEDIMRVIDDCLPDDFSVRSRVSRDISWYMRGNHDDKAKLILGLCRFLKRNKEVRKNSPWVQKLYENVDVSLIEKRLKDTFL